MRLTNLNLIKFVFILILFASCKYKVAFTSDLQNHYSFSEPTLKKIQFYTSEEIILYKMRESGDVSVSEGKILTYNEKKCDRIVIKKNTPCIVDSVIDKQRFLLSFEFGKDKVLLFGYLSDGNYSLMAQNWKDHVGTVKYANKNYATTSGETFLKVNLKKLNSLKKRERIVKGRTL